LTINVSRVTIREVKNTGNAYLLAVGRIRTNRHERTIRPELPGIVEKGHSESGFIQGGTEMKRYEPPMVPWEDQMCETPDGAYVLFEDVKELEAKLAYQTSRAVANWRALCACRGEDE